MTILSIVCTKLLCTNAHLGRRVADHHFKVYIRGSRNGIAILDSDKTLICLRNALHFIGSLSRQKGRFFFLKTNHLFYLEIMEEMVSYLRSYLRNVNSHCFDDSQWKIGAFLTNSFANKKKFRSRKKKIHFGLNQQPDCVVILNADRKSSVILEADRSQIPILSLGDSTIPWESYKRITYPIPSRDTIEIVYFFCHLIMKTVIIEQKAMTVETKSRIKKTNSTFPRGTMVRGASSSTSSPKRGRGNYYCMGVQLFTLAVVATVFLQVDPSLIASDQARELLIEWIISLSQSAYHIWRAILEETWNGRERCAPMGGTELESPSRSGEETYKAPHVHLMLSSDSDSDSVNQGGGSDVTPLSIDLSRTAECQEHIRQYAESIKDFRIDEQFESFKNDEFTKPLYEQLCAYVGDADAVKNECIREISENFPSTDAGLIDFVKQTDTSEGQRVVIFDLIKLHFLDELDKLPPELQLNANPENESSSEDDSDEDE